MRVKKPESGEKSNHTNRIDKIESFDSEGNGERSSASTRTRLGWAQLLKRVFAIALTTCPQCGGTLTLLATIEDPTVIIKILAHLGLPTRAPPRAPARLDAFMQTA